MDFSTQDYLKKTLLDTQERVRDFMRFSQTMEDKNLQKFFHEFSEIEAHHAHRLQEFIEK